VNLVGSSPLQKNLYGQNGSSRGIGGKKKRGEKNESGPKKHPCAVWVGWIPLPNRVEGLFSSVQTQPKTDMQTPIRKRPMGQGGRRGWVRCVKEEGRPKSP